MTTIAPLSLALVRCVSFDSHCTHHGSTRITREYFDGQVGMADKVMNILADLGRTWPRT